MLTRKDLYDFLYKIKETHPQDSSEFFIDIIVNSLVFSKEEGEFMNLSVLDKEIAILLQKSDKLGAIKLVMDKLQKTLKESKEYVESKRYPCPVSSEPEVIHKHLCQIIGKIVEDYHLESISPL
jgi:hypothetical protein